MKEFGPRGEHVPLAPSPLDPPLANDFVPNGVIVLLSSPNVCQCAHHTLQLPFIFVTIQLCCNSGTVIKSFENFTFGLKAEIYVSTAEKCQ